jgi:hypothetical protein
VKDAAGQPGIRASGLVHRDPAVDNPRAAAARVIREASAHGVQFKVVQLLMLLIAALGHLRLPLLKEGIIPLMHERRSETKRRSKASIGCVI